MGQNNNLEKLKRHGGNVRLLANKLGISADDLVDFSSNINPYGPPGSVSRAVKRAINNISDYPEQEAESLIGEIANHLEIDETNIVAGNGTIELIYMLPRVLKSNRVLLPVPSFTEYELSLYRAGAKIVYKNAFTESAVAKVIKKPLGNIDMVVIGNPNNPCGYLIEKSALLKAIDNNPECMWVLDEAFIDFTEDGSKNSLIKEAASRDNLVVLRSLTKIFGIAGLRLGYMVAPAKMAEKIREAKYPWSVNSVAIAAGIAALKDKSFVSKSVSSISKEAERFYDELLKVDGLYPFKPSANYILVRIEKAVTSVKLQEMLLRRRFVIRDCSSYTGMDDRHFRVAVKLPEDNQRLIGALREVLGE